MKQYEITIHGDRYPIRTVVSANDWADVIKQSIDFFQDKFRLSGRLKKLSISMIKLDDVQKQNVK